MRIYCIKQNMTVMVFSVVSAVVRCRQVQVLLHAVIMIQLLYSSSSSAACARRTFSSTTSSYSRPFMRRRFLDRSTTRTIIPYSAGIPTTSSFTNLPMPTTTSTTTTTGKTTWVAAYTTTRNCRAIATPLCGDSSRRYGLLFRKNHGAPKQRRHIWFLRGGAFDPEAFEEATDDDRTTSPHQHNCDHSLPSLLNVYPVSVCSVQGYRNHMEDEFLVAHDLAAVFDGHGGDNVSLYLKQNLYAHLQSTLPRVLLALKEEEENNNPTANHAAATAAEYDDTLIGEKASSSPPPLLLPPQQPAAVVVASVEHYVHALKLALDKVDQEVIQINHWSYQGSTAVVAWIHQESSAAASTSSTTTTASTSSIIGGQPPPTITDTSSSSSSSSTRDSENSQETSTSIASTTAAAAAAAEAAAQPQTRRTLIVANIGDSRAILSRNEEAIILTRDQKPNDPIEHARIINAGGRVTFHSLLSDDIENVEEEDGYLSWDSYSESRIPGIFRVNGNLALARAIGDRAERPAISAEPEISITCLDPTLDEFVVIATDGLWDVMSSSHVVAYIHALLEQNKNDNDSYATRDEIAHLLVEEALRRGSSDNISVVIIWLKDDL